MTNLLETSLLKNEYWWGGAAGEGFEMPFSSAIRYSFDLGEHLQSNQGAPLLISNKGRFLWSETAFKFSFDSGLLKVEGSSELIFQEGFGNLRGAFLEASKRFFPPSGDLPDPLFFKVPQYNTWIEMGYYATQEKVVRYAETILENNMPPGVLMIDDNWHEDYGVWKFRHDRFPDPKTMVDQLHQMGFKVMLWTCPFVSPDCDVFRMLEKQKGLVRNADGTTAIRKWWNGYSALLDCTNEKTVQWYLEQNQALMDQFGIDGFKLDAGDPTYYGDDDIISFPGTKNDQCEAWAKVGLQYDYNEYRSCWKLAGQPLVQRIGDKAHAWTDNGIDTLIPIGMAQGLSGFAFICPDMVGGGMIGDFSDPSFQLDQELFVRYAQVSALFPMMQFSIAPWRVLDAENLNFCMDTVRLHDKLSDEIINIAYDSAKTGEPILRHMSYMFPDGQFEQIHDQFMLGEQILAAPVVTKGTIERKVKFPEGLWQSGDGVTQYEGPCEVLVDAPLSFAPFFRRI